MKILLLDNYDSFTYNLAHRLHEVSDAEVSVVRNDAIEVGDVANYTHLVLSPGPGLPSEAGKMMEVIEAAKGKLPILGVCLGHQALAESFGGKLLNLDTVVHGKEHEMTVVDEGSHLFKGLPKTFPAGRYHSWVVDPEGFPGDLKITARGPEQEIMAIEHTDLPIFGVQFHPESVMTEAGYTMLKNWLAL